MIQFMALDIKKILAIQTETNETINVRLRFLEEQKYTPSRIGINKGFEIEIKNWSFLNSAIISIKASKK